MISNAENMKQDLLEMNETGGVIFKMKSDPRITKVGRVIRKLSIDELPTTYNVSKGDMSLVGPRPHPPKEVELLHALKDRRRLEAIPGLTCFWQVSGRSDIKFRDSSGSGCSIYREPVFLGQHQASSKNHTSGGMG